MKANSEIVITSSENLSKDLVARISQSRLPLLWHIGVVSIGNGMGDRKMFLCPTIPRTLCALVLAFVLTSCSAPILTAKLNGDAGERAYRWPANDSGPIKPDSSRLRDTLIVVTASGGGTRAAALAMGALEGLEQVSIPGTSSTLADEVDIVSSVSGGSVTAAYFALYGKGGLSNLRKNFLNQNEMYSLFSRLLDPVSYAETTTDRRSRLDAFIDILEQDDLLGKSTYKALVERARGPYLIINASDMSKESVFSFTQQQFDLLCSDLTQFRLADAVAASAAFPGVLAPMTLKDHSPCAAQVEKKNLDQTGAPLPWPPAWVSEGVGTSIYVDAGKVLQARRALSYLNYTCERSRPCTVKDCKSTNDCTNYVHLLDGGITDNLGITEPLRLLRGESGSRIANAIAAGEIKNVVFVVVNARSDKDPELDRSSQTPNLWSSMKASVYSAIDNASVGVLNDLYRAPITLQSRLLQSMPPSDHSTLDEFRMYSIPVDFDYIDDPLCRRKFKSIDTSWRLERTIVQKLIQIGRALVLKAPNLTSFETRRFGAPAFGASADFYALEQSACNWGI